MVTTDVKAQIFIDTNVLIQLHIASASLHDKARTAIDVLLREHYEIWISRQVLREYAAVLTRDQPYTSALAGAEVASQLEKFEANYKIAEDSATVTAELRQLLKTVAVGGKQVHDANIVATMRAYKIGELLTLNVSDFSRFTSLIALVSLDDNRFSILPENE